MMLPSDFDDDDREEGLPSLPPIPDQNARMLSIREREHQTETERAATGLGRLNPLSRVHNEYNDIYQSSFTSSGVLNLKELDAYVKETVRVQRQQRRRELFTKVAIVVSFVVIVTTMFGSSIFVFEDVRGSHPFGKRTYNQEKRIYEFELPPGYVQSQCEEKLTHSKSFLGLIDETEYMGTVPSCQNAVPDCDWQNPVIPVARHDANTALTAEWNAAFRFNMRHIQGLVDNSGDLDVVMIGDSIVEHWEGKDMGISEPSLRRDHEVFEELFTRHGGGKIDGMAHGIGGDRCANLLYRIENGEMPKNFDPKVWWILIGTEDWKAGVQSNAIVSGIIKIALTIREARPEAHIVINSILPRGNEEQDGNPHYESLHDINQKLECFVSSENERNQEDAETTEISFFNATNIFLFRDPEVGYFVNSALLPDYVHPSAQGEEIWGRQIVKEVLRLTENDHE